MYETYDYNASFYNSERNCLENVIQLDDWETNCMREICSLPGRAKNQVVPSK